MWGSVPTAGDWQAKGPEALVSSCVVQGAGRAVFPSSDDFFFFFLEPKLSSFILACQTEQGFAKSKAAANQLEKQDNTFHKPPKSQRNQHPLPGCWAGASNLLSEVTLKGKLSFVLNTVGDLPKIWLQHMQKCKQPNG